MALLLCVCSAKIQTFEMCVLLQIIMDVLGRLRSLPPLFKSRSYNKKLQSNHMLEIHTFLLHHEEGLRDLWYDKSFFELS